MATSKSNKKRPRKFSRREEYDKDFDSKDSKDRYLRNKKSTNDPAWYAADQSLQRDAASIPFSWAFGTKVDFNLPFTVINGVSDVVPGIMVERLIPTLGNTVAQENAPNVAAFAAYSYIRHANSGHSNYEASDLMLYLISCAEIYSYIVFLQRCYGLAMTYAQKNRYMPKAVLTASGVDFTDIVNHLADFRMRINVIINKMSSMAVPATMPYFNRLAFLYKNLYIDGSNIKNQMYMYAPAGFHVFTYDSEGKGFLQWRPWTAHSTYNIEQLIQMAEDMIQPIIEDEDMNIMSGDILKAYGSNNIITLTSVPEMYNIIPIYDINVLEQMKNATPVTAVNLDITQDAQTSQIVCDPQVTNPMHINLMHSNRILTTERDDPTPDIVLEITRLMASADLIGTTEHICPGSEICFDVTYYSLNPVTHDVEYMTLSTYMETLVSGGTTVSTLVRSMPYFANFKYHPAMYNFLKQNSTSADEFYGLIYDIDNYAVLDAADISKLNTAAILNMLNVPSVAKAAK